VWEFDPAEPKTSGVSPKYQVQYILQNPAVNGDVKGICSAANGEPATSPSQTFDYSPAGERLYLSYTGKGGQLSLTFKLNTKL
jgi:hypothetical protein